MFNRSLMSLISKHTHIQSKGWMIDALVVDDIDICLEAATVEFKSLSKVTCKMLQRKSGLSIFKIYHTNLTSENGVNGKIDINMEEKKTDEIVKTRQEMGYK